MPSLTTQTFIIDFLSTWNRNSFYKQYPWQGCSASCLGCLTFSVNLLPLPRSFLPKRQDKMKSFIWQWCTKNPFREETQFIGAWIINFLQQFAFGHALLASMFCLSLGILFRKRIKIRFLLCFMTKESTTTCKIYDYLKTLSNNVMFSADMVRLEQNMRLYLGKRVNGGWNWFTFWKRKEFCCPFFGIQGLSDFYCPKCFRFSFQF